MSWPLLIGIYFVVIAVFCVLWVKFDIHDRMKTRPGYSVFVVAFAGGIAIISNLNGTIDGANKLFDGANKLFQVTDVSSVETPPAAPRPLPLPTGTPDLAKMVDATACANSVIFEAPSDRKSLDLSRSSLIKCLDSTECKQAAASVCTQAGASVDLAGCARQTLYRLSEADRRELAVQFESRLCFQEALVWIVAARGGDMKSSLARWKRRVCETGRSALLEDSNTQQIFSNFGVSDPSYNSEVPWKTCIVL